MLMEQRMELRGSGGELLRSAVTPFIQNMAESKFPCHNEDVVDLWKMIIDDNLVHKDAVVQERAICAVAAFANEYFNQSELDGLVGHYQSQLDASELHLRGFALALGSLPKSVLCGRLHQILPVLIEKTAITKRTEMWAEGRRDVLKAIVSMIKTVGVSTDGTRGESQICEANVVPIYDCFLKALEDYTHDRRGDIGAWVREAAMSGLSSLTMALAAADPGLVPQVCMQVVMPKIAQQSVEKIDRTRSHAALIFASLVTSPLAIPHIPQKEGVLEAFPDNIRRPGPDFDGFGWAVESETFPIFARLLRFPEYAETVLLGLVTSVGGVTERLVRQSSLSLFKQLETMSSGELDDFGRLLTRIFQSHQKVDRVTLPLIKCLDQLLSSGWLQPILAGDFAFEIFNLVKAEITKCGEPNKLMASVDVFCGLLQSENATAKSKCLVQLSIFLCHKFPRIRKVTAAKLFETLLLYDAVIPDEAKRDEVNTLLSDTNWDLAVEELRPIRNDLCDLLGVQPPALIKKPL